MNRLLCVVVAGLLVLPALSSAQWVRYECEEAELTGEMDIYNDENPPPANQNLDGYSGQGYVRLHNPGGNLGDITVYANVREAGTYNLRVGVGVDIKNEKWDNYFVNGKDTASRICREQYACDYEWTMERTTDIHEIPFAEWVTFRDALVTYGIAPRYWQILDQWLPSWNDGGQTRLDPMQVAFESGRNSVSIIAGWGWASYDYIELEIPDAPTAINPPDSGLSGVGQIELEWENVISGLDYVEVWFGPYEPNDLDPNSFISPANYKSILSLLDTIGNPSDIETTTSPVLLDGQQYAWVVDGFDGLIPPDEPNYPGVFFSFTAYNNSPPDANAGPDQYLWLGGNVSATLNLDSTSTDDGLPQEMTYLWEQLAGPPVTINNADTANATASLTELAANYEPDTDDPYVFRLTVNDGQFSDTDTLNVTLTSTSCRASAEAGSFPVFGDITNPTGETTAGGDNIPDCKVDMYDLAEVAVNWMICTNIFESCD